MAKIVDRALEEAQLFKDSNFSGVVIENMFDVPYLKQRHVEPQTITTMAVIANQVRQILKRDLGFKIGVQILSGANKEALSVALSADCDFIRTEAFVFGHLGDEGYIESCAGQLLRFKNQIGAQNIKVFCDIKKKHSSHALTG